MSTAHIITTEAEAIDTARALAARFREGAGERDRDRRLPWAELDESLASGLWGITIPREYGGAFVRQRVVAEVFRILASGDSSLAQIPQNHVEIIDLVRQTGSDAQKRLIFGRVLQGARLGNAFSEYKGKNVEDFQTRIRREGDFYVVNGEKFYSTGAFSRIWCRSSPSARMTAGFMPPSPSAWRRASRSSTIGTGSVSAPRRAER